MNKKIRGLIEETLDSFLDKDLAETISWVTGYEIIESQEDFALGYVLGSAMMYAHKITLENKLHRKRVRDWEKEFGEKPKWADSEGKPFKIELTEKEMDDLRDMLKRRIPEYKEKITMALNR